MFREHGRPDLQREEEAIDALGALVRARRRLAVIGSLATSGVVAIAAVYAAGTWGATDVDAAITGKALGVIFAFALFGSFALTHRLAALHTRRWAEAHARTMSVSQRCDEEPLVEAARMFSGG